MTQDEPSLVSCAQVVSVRSQRPTADPEFRWLLKSDQLRRFFFNASYKSQRIDTPELLVSRTGCGMLALTETVLLFFKNMIVYDSLISRFSNISFGLVHNRQIDGIPCCSAYKFVRFDFCRAQWCWIAAGINPAFQRHGIIVPTRSSVVEFRFLSP